MRIGFYAGSFDPFTNGHLHVVEVALKIFDKVIIGIGSNSNKPRRYDKYIMKSAIEKIFKERGIDNVSVITYDNTSVDVASEYNSTMLIRGLRNDTDYVYEENVSKINQEISGLDTIYIRAGNLGFVSSSMVVELLEYNKDVSKYVPKEVLEIL